MSHAGRRAAASVLSAVLLAFAATAFSAAPAYAEAEVVETTLTMTVDPGTPGAAVLRAEMIGPYVDAGNAIPAGTWSFLVADGSGATLFEQQVDQPAGGPTSAEIVWPDVPAGITVNGIVTYVPSEPSEQVEFAGATAAFESEGISADSTELNRSEAVTTPAQDSDDFSVWLAFLVAASLLVATVGIVLLVRRDRRSAGAGT